MEKTLKNKGEEERIKKKKFEERLLSLHNEATAKGLTGDAIKAVFLDSTSVSKESAQKEKGIGKSKKRPFGKLYITVGICFAIIVAISAAFIRSFDIQSWEDVEDILYGTSCLLENDAVVMEIARPLAKCSFCEGMHDVAIERNLTPENFLKKYAHTSVPVLVKDATFNWTAMTTFSYHFFKELYNGSKRAFQYHDDECQFFPYKTEFESLKDGLSISDARANFSEGEKPWYFGWSNCDDTIAKKLRQHYTRPYFIPEKSESSSIDWMFMGGPGPGAFVHLDYVEKPSWQAQISGKKTWTLVPVPECEGQCHTMNVTVHKGDIIVIDTNQWYHATFIHPGEISLTIGSEYELN